MAIDKTLKLEIRAVYESNTLSVAKVLDRFNSCDISAKTIESWVLKEKWIKNKFTDEKIAIEKLIDVEEMENQMSNIRRLKENFAWMFPTAKLRTTKCAIS